MSQGSKEIRLKAVDLLTDRDGTVSNKDARLYNVLTETNGAEIDVLKRPGFSLYSGTSTGVGMGLCPIVKSDNSPKLLSVNSDNLWGFYDTGVPTTAAALLHFDGADGATTTTDVYGNTVTIGGTQGALSITHAKYGPTSLYTLAGGYAEISGPTTLGAAGWTMEIYFYYATGGNKALFMAFNAGGFGAEMYMNPPNLLLRLSSNGTTWDIYDAQTALTGTPTANNWHHGALVYDNVAGMYYAYVDGVLQKSVTSASTICAITKIRAGCDNIGNGYNGWVDEFRFSGSCRYPGGTTFTPPTSAFTPDTTQTVQASIGALSNGLTGAPIAGWTPSNLYDFAQTSDLTKIAIKNTYKAWNYTVATDSIAAVTDANYPTRTTRGLVYLNGNFYVMSPTGTVYGSNPGDFTTWNALNFVAANGEPDPAIALMKLNQYVVAFKQYTTNFLFDAGNATGSPLSPVQNAQLLIGAASADCVVGTESALYFVGQSKSHGQSVSAGFTVNMIMGMQAPKISDDNVERLLNADGLNNAWAIACNMLAHSMYIINLPTTGKSIAFDIGEKKWYFFTMRTLGSAQSIGAGNMTYTTQTNGTALASVTLTTHGFNDGDPIIIAGATQTAYNGTWNVNVTDANTFTFVPTNVPAATPATGSPTAQGSSESNLTMLMPCQYNDLQVFQNQSDGKIYQIVNTTYTDNAVFIDSRVRTARQDAENTQSKFCAWMDVVTDRVTANALVRYTDDDYQTYSKYRAVSLSGKRSRLTRQGSFIRRAFEVRHTDATAFRFQGLDCGLEQGTE